MPIGGYTAKQSVLASSARTTSGQTNDYNMSEWQYVVWYINVTAVSGASPVMNVKVKDSPDGITFYEMETEIEITETGQYRIAVTDFGKNVRLDYTISGTTPSFTFTIDYVGRATGND